MTVTRSLHSKRAKAYGLLLLNTILWGFAPPIIKQSLRFITPNQFLLGRYLIASLIFLPICWKLHKLKLSQIKDPVLLIFLALLGTPLTLIPLYEGIKLTTSIEASILTATGPLTVILGGWLFLKEKITHNEKIGLFIALLGTSLLTIEPLLSQKTVLNFSIAGNLLILLSNLVWTVFLLLIKKFKTDASLISLTSYLISIPAFGFLVFLEKSSINLSQVASYQTPLLGILYMAIFGSIIAFWAYTKGQEYIEAGEAAIFTYLQPIFTFPLAYFWLHEKISSIGFTACLFIIVGVYFSEFKPRPPRKAPGYDKITTV